MGGEALEGEEEEAEEEGEEEDALGLWGATRGGEPSVWEW